MKKKIIVGSILISMLTTNVALASSFKDVKGHWAEGYINLMDKHDLISGYKDGTFKPNNDITVAEYTTMTLKARGINAPKLDGYWYEGIIQKAKDEGIIKEGEFNDYNKKITRGEMARIAVRSLKEVGNGDKTEFKDDKDIPHSLKPYINRASQIGLLKGNPDGTFGANNKLTRSEASTVIIKTSSIPKEDVNKELSRVKAEKEKKNNKENKGKEEKMVKPNIIEEHVEGALTFRLLVDNIEDYKEELKVRVDCISHPELNNVFREEGPSRWMVDSREWWRPVNSYSGAFMGLGKDDHHPEGIWIPGTKLKFNLEFEYGKEKINIPYNVIVKP